MSGDLVAAAGGGGDSKDIGVGNPDPGFQGAKIN